MPISLKRAYEKPVPDDGYRVLVDRLWPRGVSREEARLDEWLKEAAPSNQLRKSFHADPSDWDAFRTSYLSELEHHRQQLKQLAQRAEKERVTLVFSARDQVRNNAAVLKEYLEGLAAD